MNSLRTWKNNIPIITNKKKKKKGKEEEVSDVKTWLAKSLWKKLAIEKNGKGSWWVFKVIMLGLENIKFSFLKACSCASINRRHRNEV